MAPQQMKEMKMNTTTTKEVQVQFTRGTKVLMLGFKDKQR